MAERIGRQSPTQSFVLPYRDTAGPEAVEIYEKSGRKQYDRQKLLDDVILARNKDGRNWMHILQRFYKVKTGRAFRTAQTAYG